jgi:hypothetical protein
MFLTCYLTNFSGLNTCVCCFTCDRLTLLSSSIFSARCSFGLFQFSFPMFALWNCITMVFQYFVYPLSFWDKKLEYFYFLDWDCIFKSVKWFFVPEWLNGEFVSFIGYIMSTKTLSCKVTALTGTPYDFRIFKYLEFISLIWKET